MSTSLWQEKRIISFDEVPAEDLPKAIETLFDHLELHLVRGVDANGAVTYGTKPWPGSERGE